jgi:ABC-type multidrug transport system ATPase subunit/ABC-type multidrug transport system permease subunit
VSVSRSWIIGSDPACDLVVASPVVSGRHCRLVEQPEGFLIEDLGSTNGVFVAGQRILGSARVARGDRVTLGSVVPMPWPSASPAPVSPSRSPGMVIRLGRDPDNDLVIDAPMVSGHHAKVVIQDGRATIEDLGSTNGTFVNTRDQPITRAPLRETDTVFLGSHRVPASRLVGTAPRPASHAGKIAFRGDAMTFGRDPECDQVLDYPMISWRHARLLRKGSETFVEDLGSSNGTYVNGQRIGHRPVAVRIGDTIGLGSYTFTLAEGGTLARRDYRGDVTVEARSLGVEVPGKQLLDGVSLTIYPTEFVGLMGPSGAGKSTLMKALNGYQRPTEGVVFLNGVDLYANYESYRGHLGYVPQDDIIHRDLTVGQALRFTARLRLPSDYKGRDIDKRIRTVLQQLGLSGTENVLVGSPERGGVSGGQRKRVNLAMELLTDPSVLFLDEPTSGLSSEDTLMVMRLLRSLADSGKTILLTIHQPGLEAFRLLDNLAVVARDQGSTDPGRLVYYGPADPEAIEFFNPTSPPRPDRSPDEVLRGLGQDRVTTWIQRFQGSKQHRQFVAERQGKLPGGAEGLVPARSSAGSLIRQWWTLVRRMLAIKAQDVWNTLILLIQAPIIAILVVLVFGKQATAEITSPRTFEDVARGVASTTFVLGLAAIWFGCSNAVREIVGEWSVYQRERMVNLGLVPYLLSKFTVHGLLCLFQCLVLLVIVRWGIDLRGPFWPMFGVLALASMVGVAVGLTVSAVAKTSEAAIALLPIIILPMLLLGGALQPLHKLKTPLPHVAALFPSRWAFEGLLTLEADQRDGCEILEPPKPSESHAVEVEAEAGKPFEPQRRIIDMAEFHFPAEDHRLGVRTAVLALLALLGGIASTALTILRTRDVH